MAKKEIRVPDSELKLLRVLWEKGPCTARQIREEIQTRKEGDLAHSTVMTQIQRMEEKGYVEKTGEQVGKAFVFRAKLQPDKVRMQFVKKYLTSYFGANPLPIFSWLIDSSELSEEDIAQIRAMLDERERKE
jgi:BlaI family transcriptional regulator, penicillinase repressor